jgi:hypothetical protein
MEVAPLMNIGTGASSENEKNVFFMQNISKVILYYQSIHL